MPEYRFEGNYRNRSRLKGNMLHLGGPLNDCLKNQDVDRLYIYMCEGDYGDEGRIRLVELNPIPIYGETFSSRIVDGKIKIPKRVREYANLGQGKIPVIGMFDCLEVWNEERVRRITEKPLTDEDLRRVSEKLSGLKG